MAAAESRTHQPGQTAAVLWGKEGPDQAPSLSERLPGFPLVPMALKATRFPKDAHVPHRILPSDKAKARLTPTGYLQTSSFLFCFVFLDQRGTGPRRVLGAGGSRRSEGDVTSQGGERDAPGTSQGESGDSPGHHKGERDALGHHKGESDALRTSQGGEQGRTWAQRRRKDGRSLGKTKGKGTVILGMPPTRRAGACVGVQAHCSQSTHESPKVTWEKGHQDRVGETVNTRRSHVTLHDGGEGRADSPLQ